MHIIKCLTSSILVDGLIWLFVIKRKGHKVGYYMSIVLKKNKNKKTAKGSRHVECS